MNGLADDLDEDLLWTEAWNYLIRSLDALSVPGKDKLSALTRTEKGKLCATCLAIDLMAEALEPRQLADIFEHLSADDSDICGSIAKALSREEYEAFTCCSKLEAPPPREDDGYVTVMEIATFITKFVKPNTGESFSPDEVDKVIATYFDGEGDLSSLVKCDLRPSKRLWVLPRSEYNFLLDRATRGKSAKVFLDALGLTLSRGHGVNGLPHLVAVLYPQRHDCDAKQPTALDAWWGNPHVQFISFGRNDGWGRTYSCTGSRYFERDLDGMPRERVHHDHRGLGGFSGHSIGQAPPILQISQHEIFVAALRRFASTRRNTGAEGTS
jgi:hypothetical protein